MSTQIFVNPNASPELIEALDLEALAAHLSKPFVYDWDTTTPGGVSDENG